MKHHGLRNSFCIKKNKYLLWIKDEIKTKTYIQITANSRNKVVLINRDQQHKQYENKIASKIFV